MNSFILYLGFFYIFLGAIFLFVPIFYLELGRSKDLIKALFNFLIGFILIIKNRLVNELFFVILLLSTFLISFYVIEIFLSRWHQLTDNEKIKLTTFLEFKNNLSKILEAINLGFGDFIKPLKNFNFDKNNQNLSKKKWVRNDKNDNIKV